jgi:hypothetical protein
MPVQIIPPMFRMLADEIKWAIDDVRIFILFYSAFWARATSALTHFPILINVSPSYHIRRTNHTISPTSYSSPVRIGYHPKKRPRCNRHPILRNGRKAQVAPISRCRVVHQTGYTRSILKMNTFKRYIFSLISGL